MDNEVSDLPEEGRAEDVFESDQKPFRIARQFADDDKVPHAV